MKPPAARQVSRVLAFFTASIGRVKELFRAAAPNSSQTVGWTAKRVLQRRIFSTAGFDANQLAPAWRQFTASHRGTRIVKNVRILLVRKVLRLVELRPRLHALRHFLGIERKQRADLHLHPWRHFGAGRFEPAAMLLKQKLVNVLRRILRCAGSILQRHTQSQWAAPHAAADRR